MSDVLRVPFRNGKRDLQRAQEASDLAAAALLLAACPWIALPAIPPADPAPEPV